MLLHELTGVKKYHNLDWYGLTKKLEQETGVKPVSNGRYGVIFTKPEWDYVMKIFDDDPHYLAFVDFVLAHPSRNYPKIIKKPIKIHNFHSRDRHSIDKFYIIKIEKLYPISAEMGEFLELYLERFAEVYYRQFVASEQDKNSDDYTERSWMTPTGRVTMSAFEMLQKFDWLRSLSKAYMNIILADLGSPDMHQGNMMQRTDGTVVLIDPVWAGESFQQKELRAMRDNMGDWVEDLDPDDTITGPSYLKKNQPKPPEPKKEKYSFIGPADPRIPF